MNKQNILTDMENNLKKVSTIEECIIEPPLVEVFVDGKSIGFHNEYTITRIRVAVYKGEIPNNVTFMYKGVESKLIDNRCIEPEFDDDFHIMSKLLMHLLP